MSLQSILTSFQTNDLPRFDGGDGTKPIDVQVSEGEFQGYGDLLQKVVSQALGTTDITRADEFIRQSGFDFGKNLPPRMHENGKTFYRFEPSADFTKSIESFQRTGKAIKLRETGTPFEKPAITSADISQKQTDSAKYPNYQPKPIQPPAAKKIIVSNAVVPPKKAAESNWVKVKLDPNDFAAVTKGKDGKLTVQIKTADGDPRQEINEAAFRTYFQGKYSSQTLDLYLQQHQTTDGNSVFKWNKNTDGADVPASLDETKAKLGAAIVNNQPYEFGIDKTVGSSLAGIEIENFGSDEAKLNLKVKDRLKEIDNEYDKIPIQNDLQKAAVEWKREIVKDAIDEIVSGSNVDFRKSDESGSVSADNFEKAMRTLVDNHPIYGFLPESAKQELVNFGVGIGKGTVNLVGSAAGIGNFVRDAAQDLIISGAEKAGVDVTNVKQNFEASRRSEQQMWSQAMNARTKEMARGDYAYAAKNANGLHTTLYDTPNWAVSAGDLTAQAIPFLIVGAATGGMSVPAQMAITGAVSGAKELGGNYVQTGDRIQSLKSAAWGAAQGATIPLTAKLPFPVDVVSNAATGYVFAKVQNPNADDNQIVQSIILQTAQGGAFKLGSELHQTLSQKVGRNLSETELKQTYEQEVKNNLEVIKQEVAKSAAEQGKKVIEDLRKQTKTTLTDNAKIAETKIQGNTKRAELETKLKTAQAENAAKKLALKLEKEDGGHSVDRHGPETPDTKLKTRLTTGIAPDGKFSPTPASTKFLGYGDWTQTRNVALAQIEKIYGVDLTKPPTGATKAYTIVVEYNRAIDDGFVGDDSSKIKISDPTNPKKKGNGYTKFNAVDGITRTKTRVAWDSATNKWKVVQHFPVAESWDNSSKTYNPSSSADVKVILPPKGGNK